MIVLIVFLLGLAYGYFNPGREDKSLILKKGAYYGVLIGIVLGVLSFLFGGSLLFAPFRALGVLIGVFLTIIYYTIVFIAGTYIGDWLEEIRK